MDVVTDDTRQVAVIVTRYAATVHIWCGFDAHHVYTLTRERARRIGRLLDGGAVVRQGYTVPVYDWMEERR